MDTKTYFKNRVNKLNQDQGRSNFALREVETFKILQSITGRPFIYSGSSIVDIGSGDGFMKSALESNGANYKGYDINDLDIETDSIPLDNNSQDLILSLALIEHLSSPHNMLKESLRCLKPGGTILISTPNWWYSSKHFYDDYTHIKPYSPATLRGLLEDAGFTNILDFPNLRCKSKLAYTNRWRYFLANARPFRDNTKMSFLIPSFLKGKAKGVFVLATK